MFTREQINALSGLLCNVKPNVTIDGEDGYLLKDDTLAYVPARRCAYAYLTVPFENDKKDWAVAELTEEGAASFISEAFKRYRNLPSHALENTFSEGNNNQELLNLLTRALRCGLIGGGCEGIFAIDHEMHYDFPKDEAFVKGMPVPLNYDLLGTYIKSKFAMTTMLGALAYDEFMESIKDYSELTAIFSDPTLRLLFRVVTTGTTPSITFNHKLFSNLLNASTLDRNAIAHLQQLANAVERNVFPADVEHAKTVAKICLPSFIMEEIKKVEQSTDWAIFMSFGESAPRPFGYRRGEQTGFGSESFGTNFGEW